MSPCNNVVMKKFSAIAPCIVLMLAIIVPPVSFAVSDNVIPEKTRITLQLNKHLSTKSNSEGDPFTAVVTTPVLLGDKIVIPKGSEVTGSVSRIIRPGRFKGKAVMNILFQSINIPGRGQLPIVASLARVGSEGSGVVHAEGTMEGDSSVGSDIGKVIIPGAVGAGIGGLAGGGQGAAIGTGIGTAIGLATVFATRGKDIEVPRGSTLDIVLDKPLVLPPEEEGAATKNR